MLKPDRHIDPYGTEIGLIFNSTSEAGVMMTYSTAGSGAAVADATRGVVVVGPSNPSGAKVAGLLLHPFVENNAALHRNWYKVTQYPGEPATLVKKGWVVSNNLASGATPDAGKPAYLGANGTHADAGPGPQIGRFMSRVDEQGYYRINIDID